MGGIFGGFQLLLKRGVTLGLCGGVWKLGEAKGVRDYKINRSVPAPIPMVEEEVTRTSAVGEVGTLFKKVRNVG